MSKTAKVVTIVLCSLVIVLLVGLLVAYFTLGPRAFAWSRNPHTVYESTLDGDAFGVVEVKWRAGDVRILPSEDGAISIRHTADYDVDALSVSEQDGRLVLEQKTNFGFYLLGFGTLPSDLELRLPQKEFDRLALEITSGEAEMTGLKAGEIALHMTSGDMTVSSLTAGTLSVEATSGDLTAAGCTADTLRLHSTSGDLEVPTGNFTHIEAGATSGTVRIESRTAPESFQGDLTSGKLSLTIPENDGFVLFWEKSSGDIRTTGFGLDDYTDGDKGKVNYGDNTSREYRVEMTSGTFELRKGES